ncbi:MAG: hypothetical protein AAFX05_05440 [Planctomycetota bacterium]
MVAYVVAIVLLALAVVTIIRSGDGAALPSLSVHLPALAILAGLTLVTALLSGVAFRILTVRYGHVSWLEMIALVNTAWLLNFLPLRPGLFGRVAYHKAVHGIGVRDSVRVLLWAYTLSLAGAAVVLVLGIAGASMPWLDRWLPVIAGVLVLSIAALAVWARHVRPQPDPEVWRAIAVLGIRCVELHLWAARYFICFELVGHPVTWSAALIFAAVSTVASLVPLSGNGLGVREWAVGGLAWLLPGVLAAGTAVTLGVGLEADLINRAVEVLVAVPLGLASALIVHQFSRASLTRAGASADGPSPSP